MCRMRLRLLENHAKTVSNTSKPHTCFAIKQERSLQANAKRPQKDYRTRPFQPWYSVVTNLLGVASPAAKGFLKPPMRLGWLQGGACFCFRHDEIRQTQRESWLSRFETIHYLQSHRTDRVVQKAAS